MRQLRLWGTCAEAGARPTLAPLGGPDPQVHHGGGEVPRAAPAAQVGEDAVVLGVQRGGQRGREVQVAEVR